MNSYLKGRTAAVEWGLPCCIRRAKMLRKREGDVDRGLDLSYNGVGSVLLALSGPVVNTPWPAWRASKGVG